MPNFKCLTHFILAQSINEVNVDISKGNKVTFGRTKRDKDSFFGMNTSILITSFKNKLDSLASVEQIRNMSK